MSLFYLTCHNYLNGLLSFDGRKLSTQPYHWHPDQPKKDRLICWTAGRVKLANCAMDIAIAVPNRSLVALRINAAFAAIAVGSRIYL